MKKLINLILALLMVVSIAFFSEALTPNSNLAVSAQTGNVNKRQKKGIIRKGFQGGKWITRKVYTGGRWVTLKTWSGGKKVISRTKKVVY